MVHGINKVGLTHNAILSGSYIFFLRNDGLATVLVIYLMEVQHHHVGIRIFPMIAAAVFTVGQKVKDKKLELIWKIAGSGPNGILYIRCKGVTVSAWPADVELM
jgi:hypothetical protein